MPTRTSGSLLYLTVFVFIVCAIFRFLVNPSLYNKDDALPTIFQSTYNNICKCVGQDKLISNKQALNEHALVCFISNKEKLLSIARNHFNALTKDQYEQ